MLMCTCLYRTRYVVSRLLKILAETDQRKKRDKVCGSFLIPRHIVDHDMKKEEYDWAKL